MNKGNFLFKYKPLFASIIGVLLLMSFATVVSAQDSLPGQPLYSVKRVTEDVVSLVNPSFNSEILKRRSREIKHLSDPINATENNSRNMKSAIKDYENELNEHKDISKSAIEESKVNLEDASKHSSDEDKQEIEDALRRTEREEEYEDVRGESIKPGQTSIEKNTGAQHDLENSANR